MQIAVSLTIILDIGTEQKPKSGESTVSEPNQSEGRDQSRFRRSSAICGQLIRHEILFGRWAECPVASRSSERAKVCNGVLTDDEVEVKQGRESGCYEAPWMCLYGLRGVLPSEMALAQGR